MANRVLLILSFRFKKINKIQVTNYLIPRSILSSVRIYRLSEFIMGSSNALNNLPSKFYVNVPWDKNTLSHTQARTHRSVDLKLVNKNQCIQLICAVHNNLLIKHARKKLFKYKRGDLKGRRLFKIDLYVVQTTHLCYIQHTTTYGRSLTIELSPSVHAPITTSFSHSFLNPNSFVGVQKCNARTARVMEHDT